MVSEKFSFKNSKFTKNVRLINFVITQQFHSFRWLHISFNIAFKELKIAQILQVNQLFQLPTSWLLGVKSYANEEICYRWLQQSHWNVSLCDLLIPFPCALQAHFFCKIQQNGYKVLYLSARAIGQVRTSLAVSFKTDRKERDKQRVREHQWARGLGECEESLNWKRGKFFLNSPPIGSDFFSSAKHLIILRCI